MSLTTDWRQRAFLVADFEFTTHKGTYGRPRAFFPEIIEAGAIVLQPPSYDLIHTYQTFVKPRFFPRLTEECRNITMIQQKDVDAGIAFEAMLAQLRECYQAGQTYFVAWGDSDREVIQTACQRYKIACPFAWEDYIDLAAEYKLFYALERTHSLKSALEERQITQTGLCHLALDDAKNTAQVLLKMLADGWYPKVNADIVNL